MFKRILVPINSDHFPDNALKRACALSSAFGGDIYVMSILPQQIYDRIDALSSHVPIGGGRDEIKEELIRSNREASERHFFRRAEEVCMARRIAVRMIAGMGLFTDEILKAIREYDLDSIVMEFCGDSAVQYRIFEESPVPVWIEIGSEYSSKAGNSFERSKKGKSAGGPADEIEELERDILGGERNIVGICSSLSPNVRVPEILEKLALKFAAHPHLVYVVKESGIRRSSRDRDMEDAEGFVAQTENAMGRTVDPGTQLTTEIAHGNIVREVLNIEKKYRPWLVIVGRIRESELMLSLEKDVKRRLAEKTTCNLLLAK